MQPVLALVAAAALGIDAGWAPADGGGWDYVIQVEPETLEALARGAEIASDLPPEIRDVRALRIRVGNGPVSRAYVGQSAEEPRTSTRRAGESTRQGATRKTASPSKPVERRGAQPARTKTTDATDVAASKSKVKPKPAASSVGARQVVHTAKAPADDRRSRRSVDPPVMGPEMPADSWQAPADRGPVAHSRDAFDNSRSSATARLGTNPQAATNDRLGGASNRSTSRLGRSDAANRADERWDSPVDSRDERGIDMNSRSLPAPTSDRDLQGRDRSYVAARDPSGLPAGRGAEFGPVDEEREDEFATGTPLPRTNQSLDSQFPLDSPDDRTRRDERFDPPVNRTDRSTIGAAARGGNSTLDARDRQEPGTTGRYDRSNADETPRVAARDRNAIDPSLNQQLSEQLGDVYYPLVVALVMLFMSVGANFFLGWVTLDLRNRCRRLLVRLAMSVPIGAGPLAHDELEL